ncbi:Derlin-1 [Tritrichomonas foetus]|uniref:Derlin n=1 Tax=Tritrichomonas foetus TaxID=1144522 RepID=A0A1J4JRC6_9EUKA|nr:Derlin-1 [Tritrichomonas foetus]|eukprot:OHT00070.1 Derlin-1 [Tritrichomonas foetus]
MDVLQTIPPFTRVYGIVVLALGLIVSINIVSPYSLVFIPELVLKQPWRLLTSPFFIGKLDVNFLISIGTSVMMLQQFESQHFSHRLSNLVFIFVFSSILSMIFSAIFGSYSIASSVLTSLIYISSKLQPNQIINLFFVFQIPAAYYPFVSLVLSLVMGNSIIPSLIGIASGHFLFYFLFILPIETGRPLFKCPNFLARLLDGEPNPAQHQQHQRQNPLQGRGRRIGE